MLRICGSEEEKDEGDGDRFHTTRRGVYLFVAPELTVNTEIYFPRGVLADVRGPQAGELLPDST